TVVDTFDAVKEIPLVLSWHLGPDVLVDLDGAVAELTWRAGPDRQRGALVLPDGLAWTSHTAELDPVLGWYAPRFGHRVPATSLVGRGTRSSSTRLVTVLRLP